MELEVLFVFCTHKCQNEAVCFAYHLSEKDSDFFQRGTAFDGPCQVIAIAIESLRGAVDGCHRGFA